MSKHPSKLERMTTDDKLVHSKQFWDAPNNAFFPPETIAIVFNVSMSWLQLKRCTGGGIPFTKGARKVSYQKSDAIEYFNRQKLKSTSMQAAN
ncbi:DNA-binding protein [Acinetobacter guerrae]|uniref:DNA-binding protein n=1 Tax=Acinetobacter guerrae TaxID=1843371 RepID=A0A3A8EYB7_9GAMM|nr:DNA-binding protein [Acinetobacter guerrae]RKG33443.1 DNA-binding protein [Acinetobacter guerrae]